MAIAVFMLKIDLSKQKIEQTNANGYSQRIFSEFKSILKGPTVTLTLFLPSLLKAIFYGLLLWLLMYFDQESFKEFEVYIPIAMKIMAILGSIFLEFVFEKVAKPARQPGLLSSCSLLSSLSFAFSS